MMKRTVAVLGGSGAIGQTICRRLARQGYAVRFSYGKNAAAAAVLVDELEAGGAVASCCQVIAGVDDSASQIRRFLEVDGGLDAVVYASGPSIGQPFFSQATTEEWASVLAQDVLAFMSLAGAAIPILRDSRGGSIIAVTTAATQRHPSRDSLSSIPKSAVEAAIRAISREEGRYGIRANAVAPGMLGDGLGQRILQQEFDGAAQDAIRKLIPLGAFGSSDDVAAMVAFLVSDEARYVSGQTICVDGGWSA